MRFILLDTNKYYLAGTHNQTLHIASLTDGLREFMCFTFKGKIYIEEISGGSLIFIEDDSLAQALSDFLHDKKVLHPSKPLIPDNQWYKQTK